MTRTLRAVHDVRVSAFGEIVELRQGAENNVITLDRHQALLLARVIDETFAEEVKTKFLISANSLPPPPPLGTHWRRS